MATSPASAPLLTREIRLPLPEVQTVWAALGFAAIVALLLRSAIFGDQAFYERDLHLQWFGQVESFVRSIRAGSWPLWDPYVAFGQPLLANANNEVLYPPTWLHLIIRPWTYYTAFFFGHLVFAALGLYRLASRLGISRGGAFLAGALWVASGPLLSLGNAWNHLAGAAWMPWVGLAAVATADAPSPRAALAWGAAWSAQILAGSPDLFLMTGCLALVLVASRADWPWKARSDARLVMYAVLAAAFALALSAAQWIPSADVAARSGRARSGVAERTYWSVHPATLVQVVVPWGWNDLPLTAEWRSALFESREPFLLSTYVGLPTVLLATAALANRRRWCLGILALLVASTLVALGRHAPFYDVAIVLLPPLRLLRFPAKALVLMGFCGALLAGQGFDEWRRGKIGGKTWRAVRLVAAGVTLAAAVLTVVSDASPGVWAPFLVAPGPGGSLSNLVQPAVREAAWASALGFGLWMAAANRGRGAAAASACATIVAFVGIADLAWNHRSLNRTAPKAFFSTRPEAVGSIDQRSLGRLFVYDYSMAEGRSERYLKRAVPYVVGGLQGGGSYEWAGAFGMRMYLVPPTGAAWGLFGSYEKDLLGLQPTSLAELNAVLVHADGTPLATRLLRAGAVSQVLALHTQGLEDLTEVRSLPGPFFEPIHLFSVPKPQPRSYVVDGVRRADGRAALQALVDPAFKPEAEVILSEGGAPHEPDDVVAGSSRILTMAPDRVVVETEAPRAAHLVLVDAYDPGWRATVDGRPTPVFRANVAFRAVAVSAGRHVVEFLYRPSAVAWGLWVSGAALLAGAVVLSWPRRPAITGG